MAIDLELIDDLIRKAEIRFEEAGKQLDDLKFLRDIFLNGTTSEKRLFNIVGHITIDNLKALMDKLSYWRS